MTGCVISDGTVYRTRMQSIISLFAIALYLAATALIFVRLKKLAGGLEPDKAPLLSAWGGAVLLHAGVLYGHTLTPIGLNLAFFNALSIVALLVAALLLVSSVRRPLENLGVVLLPIAAISLGLNQISQANPEAPVAVGSPLQFHILISLLAYSLLSIAALQALVLAVQERSLRTRHPGGLVRALPPLQWMEHLLFQFIGAGFVLLSIALISGFVFLEDIFAQHLVHKTVLSIAAWAVFAVLLFGRWRFGWRGRTAIRWTLGGVFVLMLAYFGSKLVLELVLHRT